MKVDLSVLHHCLAPGTMFAQWFCCAPVQLQHNKSFIHSFQLLISLSNNKKRPFLPPSFKQSLNRDQFWGVCCKISQLSMGESQKYTLDRLKDRELTQCARLWSMGGHHWKTYADTERTCDLHTGTSSHDLIYSHCFEEALSTFTWQIVWQRVYL